jgi:hypothetical protein
LPSLLKQDLVSCKGYPNQMCIQFGNLKIGIAKCAIRQLNATSTAKIESVNNYV